MRFIMKTIVIIFAIIAMAALAQTIPDEEKETVEDKRKQLISTGVSANSAGSRLAGIPRKKEWAKEQMKADTDPGEADDYVDEEYIEFDDVSEEYKSEAREYRVVRSQHSEDDDDNADGYYDENVENQGYWSAEDNIDYSESEQQVMHVEISADKISTTFGNDVSRSSSRIYNSGITVDSAQFESVAVVDDLYENGGDSNAPLDTALDEFGNTVPAEQVKVKPNCPSVLYGGGNAYAINMLKKQGCHKPEFYNGVW